MALSCLVYCTASQTLDETLLKIARARKNRWLLIQEACIVYVIKKAKRRIWMNFTLYSQQRGLRSPTTLGKVLVSCTVRLTFGIYPTPVRAFPDLPIVLQTAVKQDRPHSSHQGPPYLARSRYCRFSLGINCHPWSSERAYMCSSI